MRTPIQGSSHFVYFDRKTLWQATLFSVPFLLSSIAALAAPSAPLTLNSQSMATKTVGGGYDSTWMLWGNGYIANDINFGFEGTYPISIVAYGSAAGGVYPNMVLRVDGVDVASTTVSSTSAKTYTFQVQVKSGTHNVAIAYTNDDTINGQDRNLMVNSLSIGAGVPLGISVPGSILAENMSTKTTGGAYSGLYNIWSNGYIENAFNFPKAGSYDVSVIAKGNLAGGVGPAMEVRVDGSKVAGQTLSNTEFQTFKYKINISSAGVHNIAIAYTNDDVVNGQDRNLLVQQISIAASSGSTATPTPTPTPSPSPSATSTPSPTPSATATSVPAGTLAVPGSMAAADMATKTTGGAYSGIYNVWSNGSVSNPINIPKAGNYDVTITAGAQLAGGVGPNMELRLDGKAFASKTLNDATYLSYTFPMSASAGVHTLEIAYTNDDVVNGQDRNLLLQKISIAASTSTSPSPSPSATSTPSPKPTVSSTPTPTPSVTSSPVNGVSYPFGSHLVPYVAGIRPSVSQAAQDQAVQSIYDAWKTTLRSNCGGLYVYKGGNFAAVSEGSGYGMLISVIMAGYDSNARNQFDALFRFARSKPAYQVDSNLMDWAINFDCSSGGSGYNALDGDLDIAMALLMADKQWGSNGDINYRAEAIKTINAMKSKNMNASGYTAGGPMPDISRTSDYMITHFRAFKKATGDTYWDTVISKSFELMSLMQSKYAPSTGLIPDFIVGLPGNPVPSPGNRIESNTEGYYAWNACRDPWRLASDYVTSGDARSQAIAAKLMTFLRNSSGGDPTRVYAGYKLDGSVLAQYNSMTFIGPLISGAMVDSANQAFLNNLWSYSSGRLSGNYYDNELQLLSLIVASGNWWNP